MEFYPSNRCRCPGVNRSRFGLRCAYDAPAEAFLALELAAGALGGAGGLVRYAEAFAGV